MSFSRTFRKCLSFLAVASLLVTSIPLSLADHAVGDGYIEVDFVVRGVDTIGVENAEVFIYIWDEATETYIEEEHSYSPTSSSGRYNNLPIPAGATFYGVAYDDVGNVYAGSNYSWVNIWVAQEDGSIVNVDSGSVRGSAAAYVHLYPGEDPIESAAWVGGPDGEVGDGDTTSTGDGDDGDGDGIGDDIDMCPTEDASAADDDGDGCLDDSDGDGVTDDVDLCPDEDAHSADADGDGCLDVEEPAELVDAELAVTVYDADGVGVEGALVYVYVTDYGLYEDGLVTDAHGEVTALVPLDYEFYAIAFDVDGTTYGGTYDYYLDQENYWTTEDGEVLENVANGEVRTMYLELWPDDLIPAGHDGDDADFDPDTYECAGFPDAIYSDLSPEECDAIEFVYDEGIFTGTDEGYLEWDRPINRAEVTKVMIEAFDIELLTDYDDMEVFPDVEIEGKWYSEYIYTARHYEVVDGYPDGYFRPSDTINRVEMLRVFIEASGVDYSDIPVDYTFWHDVEVKESTEWYMPYANYAFFNDLLENDGNLYAGADMTRIDVIRLLYRAEELGLL